LAFYSQVGMTDVAPSAHHSVSDAFAAKPKDEPGSTASQAVPAGNNGANPRFFHTFSNT
jgi:hypothetical protein